jgi:hypothetical protein
MRSALRIVVGMLAVFAVAACNPGPPKPKTEVERQASPEKHDKIPQPLLARKAGSPEHR